MLILISTKMATLNLKNGDQCTVVGGTHKGKSGIVQDLNTSKTGHITIKVLQKTECDLKHLVRMLSL